MALCTPKAAGKTAPLAQWEEVGRRELLGLFCWEFVVEGWLCQGHSRVGEQKLGPVLINFWCLAYIAYMTRGLIWEKIILVFASLAPVSDVLKGEKLSSILQIRKWQKAGGLTILQDNPLCPRLAEEAQQMPVGAGSGRNCPMPCCQTVSVCEWREWKLCLWLTGSCEQAAAASSLTARLWHGKELSPLYLTIQT